MPWQVYEGFNALVFCVYRLLQKIAYSVRRTHKDTQKESEFIPVHVETFICLFSSLLLSSMSMFIAELPVELILGDNTLEWLHTRTQWRSEP